MDKKNKRGHFMKEIDGYGLMDRWLFRVEQVERSCLVDLSLKQSTPNERIKKIDI